MTLRTGFGIAIPAVAVVVALLPTPVMDAIYNGVYLEGYPVAHWLLPLIMAVLSFLLVADALKAFIAGAVSFGMSMFMFGIMGIAGGDCAQAGVRLSRACAGDAVVFAKIGLAGLLCLNLFLLYRLAYPKPPKTPKATRTK